jgi:hypothetical protein
MIGMFILLAVFISGIGGLLFGVAAGISQRYVEGLAGLLNFG